MKEKFVPMYEPYHVFSLPPTCYYVWIYYSSLLLFTVARICEPNEFKYSRCCNLTSNRGRPCLCGFTVAFFFLLFRTNSHFALLWYNYQKSNQKLKIFQHLLSIFSISLQDELVSTCDRYVSILNHMKQSPQEKMSVGDKAVATGRSSRNWFPILFSCAWNSLISFLLKKAVAVIVYFLSRFRRYSKLKVK